MANYVNLMDVVYPIGSIYQTMKPTSPSSTIGGTWTQIKTFLMGSTSSGVTGGEATHVLTINEMPIHSHQQNVTANEGGPAIRKDYNADATVAGAEIYPQGATTEAQGGGQAHNNLPPYTTCFIWYRTA